MRIDFERKRLLLRRGVKVGATTPSHNGDDHDGGVSGALRGDGNDSDGDGALHSCVWE